MYATVALTAGHSAESSPISLIASSKLLASLKRNKMLCMYDRAETEVTYQKDGIWRLCHDNSCNNVSVRV